MMKTKIAGCWAALALVAASGWASDAGRGAAVPGFMSTRGFARTSLLDKSEGKEAIVRFRFELPYGLAAGWRVPYLGFSDVPAGEFNIEILRVAALVDFPDASRKPGGHQLTFSGKPNVVVPRDNVVESDAVNVPVPPGAVLYVETYYRNAAPAGKLPCMNWGYTAAGIDAGLVGDRDALAASSGSPERELYTGPTPPAPLLAGQPYLIRSYQPMGVVGRPHPDYRGPVTPVVFIGDSIAIANGDFGRADADDPYPARGWNGRVCADRVPYLVYGQGGSTGVGFRNLQGKPLFVYLFGDGSAGRKFTHLVDGYGINNLRDRYRRADRATDWQLIWRQRAEFAAIAHRQGLAYLHTTLTPMTAGCMVIGEGLQDKKPAEVFADFIADRRTFNEQVRTTSGEIPGCVGFIDCGGAVEENPAAGDNRWLAAFILDGIHPNSAACRKMAAAVPPDLFAKHPNPLPPVNDR
ncbi:MAG: SGNH/GDSL hydrolase family protein [Verrucomicrobiales bacterium]|jgi:hypothetical protein|nr:SGNH/GDSL hydrolase family protein [Verrucomicrobiales bacterium]